MNVVALGSAFNLYFPLFILLIAIATVTNCYAKVLALLNINVFRFDEDFEHDHLENGRAIATLEKVKKKHYMERNVFNIYFFLFRIVCYDYCIVAALIIVLKI